MPFNSVILLLEQIIPEQFPGFIPDGALQNRAQGELESPQCGGSGPAPRSALESWTLCY